MQETEVHRDVKQLQKVAGILVKRHDERFESPPDVYIDGTMQGDPDKIKKEFYRGPDDPIYK